MSDRIFAVVTLTDISDKVNTAGQSVIDNARHSVDSRQIVLDFNHHRATIDGLFLDGIDVDDVIAGCEMLNHSIALELMKTAEWGSGVMI